MTAEEVRSMLQGAEIFVVPYCHADWAWTHNRRWHELRYVHVFENVLDIMRENADFRWYFDSWITQFQAFVEHCPERVAELQRRVAEGRIAICGGYANLRPNMVGEETFLRNLIHGRTRFSLKFPEADLRVHADAVDVALGHPQMPQVLRLAGYDYFRCWRPQAGLSVSGVPYEFFWRGLDGSFILCARGSYGGLCAIDAVPAEYAADWEAAVSHLGTRELELIARHSPSRRLWLSQGMDDSLPLKSHGGDRYIDVPGLMAVWNEREHVPMRFATPLEFFTALEHHGAELPVCEGTLDPCDVCYNAAWGGALGLWRRRFAVDKELVDAQLWQVLAQEYSPDIDFSHLWENALLCSAHATQWLFQDDFDEFTGLADFTILSAREARRHTLRRLAARVPRNDGDVAVVFNSLPRERQETVRVLVSASTGIPAAIRLVDGNDAPVPCQLTTRFEYADRTWEAEAVARVSVPPGGYTTLRWEAAEAPPAPAGDMDNGLIVLHFDGPRLQAVRAGGRQYTGSIPWNTLRAHDVDTNAPLNVGPITAVHEVTWREFGVKESGPVRWRHVAWGHIGAHELCLETLLHAGEARVEFRLQVDWRGADGFLTASWPMPFAGRLTADVPFGAEEKNLDEVTYGTLPGHSSNNIERLREGMFYARSFVSLADGAGGVTHISHDGDRYYLREAKQQVLSHILINSLLPEETGWHQHINRQRAGVGRHEFTYSLVFHQGDWRDAGMMQTSAALRQPLEIISPVGSLQADLPSSASFIAIEPQHVLLSALYEEDEAVFLRVWEAEGRPAHLAARLPFAPLSASLVDLNGETLAKEAGVVLAGDTLHCQLRPWQIAVFRLIPPRKTAPHGCR